MQQGELDGKEELEEEQYPSSIPFFPPVNEKTIQSYIQLYAVTVSAIILFGGLLAPSLEVHMGLGGAGEEREEEPMKAQEQEEGGRWTCQVVVLSGGMSRGAVQVQVSSATAAAAQTCA